MRIVLLSTLALFAASLLAAGPANATWTCIGAEYVCGGAKSSARSAREDRAVYGKPRRARAAAKRHHGSAARTAFRRGAKGARLAARRDRRLARSAGPRYTGGGSGQTGIASYYWQGQRVASGGRFNPNAMTAAHKTLPFGTRVRVTHVSSGRSVNVTINDRGPFVRGRVIDLSRAAAGVIGMRGSGLARVRVEVIPRS